MITFDEARNIALGYLSRIENDLGEKIALTETIERSFGWVFVYDSRTYLKSGDPGDMLAGNAPIFIDRRSGNVHVTGTAFPLEHYIREYEDKHGQGP